jgi:hypothetical protein
MVDPDRVLATFLDADGRLTAIPRKRAKRLVVLDRLHPDYAALRRHLVDDAFLTRGAGWYRRSGGTVDV